LRARQGYFFPEPSFGRNQHAAQYVIVTAAPFGDVILAAVYGGIADDCIVNDVITMSLVITCPGKVLGFIPVRNTAIPSVCPGDNRNLPTAACGHRPLEIDAFYAVSRPGKFDFLRGPILINYYQMVFGKYGLAAKKKKEDSEDDGGFFHMILH
jgi:hypothetical protein